MNKTMSLACSLPSILLLAAALASTPVHGDTRDATATAALPALSLHEREYFQAPGVDILAFSNAPGGLFNDAKTSGIEIIQRGERIATNGDLRFLHTPEQWDGLGVLVERQVDRDSGRILTRLRYPEHDFDYTISAQAQGGVLRIAVHLDAPLPEALAGKAGFNLEFLPAAYFGKGWLMDAQPGLFPHYPGGPMQFDDEGRTEPLPLARGERLVLAPEDPNRRISIRQLSETSNPLLLFDGRNKAQNGWFVVRSLLPAERSGTVLEWELHAQAESGWLRTPVIGHSQVGYHPAQQKRAVIELDAADRPHATARLLRIQADGGSQVALDANVQPWGSYLRYRYAIFDFTSVREPGLYQIAYGDQLGTPFRIDPRVHGETWQPTLDIFFPVQMDHMEVREAYRVWHGRSHMDDALQAPANYEHFDLYAHDANTDTSFKPFEHIPGLAIGGWYDAGDYDIRTQSQYHTVRWLVHAREQFGLDRDTTTVSQDKGVVQIHRPDGKPDILQQIEHGTLALIAQHRAIGHAIPGIVAAHLYQYTHLGDGASKTDNRIYDPALDPFAAERGVGAQYEPSTIAPPPERRVRATRGEHSGEFDDRWAFTSHTSALNYGSAAALAAASRVLRGYDDALAEECLSTARRVWAYEQGREPNRNRYGNTTGGALEDEQLAAAVELLLSTGERQYGEAVTALLPQVQERFAFNAATLAMAIPHMDADYKARLEPLVRAHRAGIGEHERENPYGVPITRGGWAGSGAVIGFGNANYWLHRHFPELIDASLVTRSVDYILGSHPGHNLSLVSGVGARSQLVAYGTNRADFSFIAGGIVPGMLILQPDFPENKQDWPFFWGQNEYVITVGASWLFLANAANALLQDP